MRSIPRSLAVCITIFIFVLSCPTAFVSAEESGCVSCHTSLKKLLQITRDMESSKPKVEKPSESKGEG